MLKRVLIGNRGEIAIRIAKAASALGMESVGVYAPVDALSLHTRYTTEAREIPDEAARAENPSEPTWMPTRSSRTAKASGCDCVHPGYGFLAENAAFAERCAAERPCLHRSAARRAGALRRQGASARARTLSRHSDRARQRGAVDVRRRKRWRWRATWATRSCSRQPAGGGGRGMRAVAGSRGDGRSLRPLPERGAGGLRGRLGVPREAHPSAATHRGADPGRRARRRSAPPRAGLLGAASPPEGHRDRAGTGPRRGRTPANPRRCRRAGERFEATSTPAPWSSSSLPRRASTSSSNATPASRSSTP